MNFLIKYEQSARSAYQANTFYPKFLEKLKSIVSTVKKIGHFVKKNLVVKTEISRSNFKAYFYTRNFKCSDFSARGNEQRK